MNFLGSVAVYAAICKHEGIPFKFLGNQAGWDIVSDTSNVDLIAEQEIWAALDPKGQNEAFNTMNGDVFKWRKVWRSIADKLEVDYVPFDGEEICLSEIMKDKAPFWEELVLKEKGLHQTKLENVGHWWFLEGTLRVQKDVLMSMNKSKEHCFLVFQNTEKEILSIFDTMKARKLIL
ncbi:unnamed protein product [Calypogeia fissa]